MNKLTAFGRSCCNSSTFRSLSCLIHRWNTNDVQCVNTKVTNVVLDWIKHEICMDIVAWLSSQADINLVHVDFSVVMFFRNSSPGNIQTFGTLRSHQNLTRSNRGNWKIEKKNGCYQIFFPWKYCLEIFWIHFFSFPKGLSAIFQKLQRASFSAKLKTEITQSTDQEFQDYHLIVVLLTKLRALRGVLEMFKCLSVYLKSQRELQSLILLSSPAWRRCNPSVKFLHRFSLLTFWKVLNYKPSYLLHLFGP